MDPIQYFIAMLDTRQMSCHEVRSLVCRRFDLTLGEFEQYMIDARANAKDLLQRTERAAEAFGC